MFQLNHVKNQALFSSKDKSKKIQVSSAAIFFFGALRVNRQYHQNVGNRQICVLQDSYFAMFI